MDKYTVRFYFSENSLSVTNQSQYMVDFYRGEVTAQAVFNVTGNDGTKYVINAAMLNFMEITPESF